MKNGFRFLCAGAVMILGFSSCAGGKPGVSSGISNFSSISQEISNISDNSQIISGTSGSEKVSSSVSSNVDIISNISGNTSSTVNNITKIDIPNISKITDGKNLVASGNFDSGPGIKDFETYSSFPGAWSNFLPADSAGLTIKVVKEGVSGTSCAKYVKTTDGSFNIHLHQMISTEQNTNYLFRAKMKTDGKLSSVIAVQGISWNILAKADNGFSSTWKEVSFIFNTAGNTSIRLSWFAGAKGQPYQGQKGTAWLDDVSIEKCTIDQMISIGTIKNTNNSLNISNKLFGTHMEYFTEPDYARKSDTYWDSLSKLNPGILRFPGGEDSNNYHWETKTIERSDWFYWDADPVGDLDTDEFLDVCKRTKSEPIICINYATGVVKNDIESVYNEAVAWAKYTNIEKGANVRYWEFGNEIFIPVHNNIDLKITPEIYAKQYLEMRKRLKAVDKNIMLGASMALRWDSAQDWLVADWAERFFKATGDNVDFIIPHFYCTPTSQSDFISTGYPVQSALESFRAGMQKTIGKILPIFVTEWNLDSRNTVISLGGLGHGVVLAEGLIGLIKGKADYACVWPLHWSMAMGQPWEGSSYGLMRDGNQKLTGAGQVFAQISSEIVGWKNIECSYDFWYSGVSALPVVSSDGKKLKIIITNRDAANSSPVILKLSDIKISDISGKSMVTPEYAKDKTANIEDVQNPVMIDPKPLTDGSNISVTLPPISVTIITCNIEK